MKRQISMNESRDLKTKRKWSVSVVLLLLLLLSLLLSFLLWLASLQISCLPVCAIHESTVESTTLGPSLEVSCSSCESRCFECLACSGARDA